MQSALLWIDLNSKFKLSFHSKGILRQGADEIYLSDKVI